MMRRPQRKLTKAGCDNPVDGDLLETVSIPCRKRRHESAGDHHLSVAHDDDEKQDEDEPARKTRKMAAADPGETLPGNERSADANIDGNGADGATNATDKDDVVSRVAVTAKGDIGTSSIHKDGEKNSSRSGGGKDRGDSDDGRMIGRINPHLHLKGRVL